MVTQPGGQGGSRIPIPLIGVQAPGGDNLPQRKEINRFVARGPVRAGQSPVATVRETRLDEQGNLIEVTTVYSAACKVCGRQMKTEDDVGGVIGGYVVCSACIEKVGAGNSQASSDEDSDESAWSDPDE